MSQFYSQTGTFSVFPIFFSKEFRRHCFFLAPWYGQILNQRLRILASRQATLRFSPGLHQQPGDWMHDRQSGCPRECAKGLFQCSGIGTTPFPPTTFLRFCLMLPGKVSGYHTGATYSFFTDRPDSPRISCPLVHTKHCCSSLPSYSASERPTSLTGKTGPGAAIPHRAFRLN